MERPTLTITVDTYLKPLPEPAASFEVEEIAKVLKSMATSASPSMPPAST
jgi:hypothetical protein